MKGGFTFGGALVVVVTLATLEAMFPVSRFLSKVDPGIFTLAKGLFIHAVLPRIGIGVGLAMVAAHLHAGGSRFAWPMLLLVPIVLFVADLVLRAFSI